VVNAAGLAAIYLLVLTSLRPGDIVVAALLGVGVTAVLPRRQAGGASAGLRPRALAGAFAATAVEMVRGSWRTARFCLGGRAAPGFVEIPREDRSRSEVALWGVLTGEAPDEIPVDVDDDRGVLIVHLIDAGDPESVRARHAGAHARARREAVR
jgi:multisubunit Na+/H+ antiporter MnhE subunit